MIRFSELLSIVYCKATSAFDSSVLTVFIAAVLYRLNQVAKLMHSSDGSGCLLQASSDSQGARPIVTFPAKAFQPKRWLQLEYAVLTKKSLNKTTPSSERSHRSTGRCGVLTTNDR